jgi:hypothetical protein
MLAGDTLIGGGMSVGMYQNRSFGCYAPAALSQAVPAEILLRGSRSTRARSEGSENWLRMLHNKKDWNLNPSRR